MPSWIMHLATADCVSRQLKINKNDFMFANIMPDMNVGWIIKSKNKIDYTITHKAKKQKLENKEFLLPDIEEFKVKYYNKLNNPVILGYWVHLLTDYFWNRLTFSKYFVYNNNNEFVGVKNKDNIIQCCKEKARYMKQKDFREFENYLVHTQKITIPYETKEILQQASQIEEIIINEDDIKKAIDFLTQAKKVSESANGSHYQMFQQDELIKYYEESVQFILNKMKIAM